jgi:hypothetical protein
VNRLSRRQLLKLGAAGTAGALAAPYFVPSGVLAADGMPGANERIGIGGRASLLLNHRNRANDDYRTVVLNGAAWAPSRTFRRAASPRKRLRSKSWRPTKTSSSLRTLIETRLGR